MLEVRKSANPFHRIEPHRQLPPQVRRVLWSACELVLDDPNGFVEAANWLHRMFSECAIRERELARGEIDSPSIHLASERGWRLAQAAREIVADGLAADDHGQARRIVVVACVLSYHRELPLSGEFCNWTWESAGTSFAAWLDRELSETYVAGRCTVLFGLGTDGRLPDWLDGFALLTRRAVRMLCEPAHAGA